jgi:hypothetical protein
MIHFHATTLISIQTDNIQKYKTKIMLFLFISTGASCHLWGDLNWEKEVPSIDEYVAPSRNHPSYIDLSKPPLTHPDNYTDVLINIDNDNNNDNKNCDYSNNDNNDNIYNNGKSSHENRSSKNDINHIDGDGIFTVDMGDIPISNDYHSSKCDDINYDDKNSNVREQRYVYIIYLYLFIYIHI